MKVTLLQAMQLKALQVALLEEHIQEVAITQEVYLTARTLEQLLPMEIALGLQKLETTLKQ